MISNAGCALYVGCPNVFLKRVYAEDKIERQDKTRQQEDEAKTVVVSNAAAGRRLRKLSEGLLARRVSHKGTISTKFTVVSNPVLLLRRYCFQRQYYPATSNSKLPEKFQDGIAIETN